MVRLNNTFKAVCANFTSDKLVSNEFITRERPGKGIRGTLSKLATNVLGMCRETLGMS